MGIHQSTTIAGEKHSGPSLSTYTEACGNKLTQAYVCGILGFFFEILMRNLRIVPWACFMTGKPFHIKSNYFYRTYCLFLKSIQCYYIIGHVTELNMTMEFNYHQWDHEKHYFHLQNFWCLKYFHNQILVLPTGSRYLFD